MGLCLGVQHITKERMLYQETVEKKLEVSEVFVQDFRLLLVAKCINNVDIKWKDS